MTPEVLHAEQAGDGRALELVVRFTDHDGEVNIRLDRDQAIALKQALGRELRPGTT